MDNFESMLKEFEKLNSSWLTNLTETYKRNEVRTYFMPCGFGIQKSVQKNTLKKPN